MSEKFENWKKDFEGFIQATPVEPPSSVYQSVHTSVLTDLRPAPGFVFFKLSLIHVFTLALTLTVCPQLGVGPIGGGHGLMGIVMNLGSTACAIFCGSFLFGTTALMSHLMLRPEEVRAVYRGKLWQFPALTVISFSLLMLSGQLIGQSHSAPDLVYLGTWFAAGIVGAILIYLAAYRIRGLSAKY